MADDKARIEAELVGANQVAGEARKIEGSLTGAGSAIEKKLGGALKSVTGGLADMVKGGLAAAGVLQTVSLAKAVEDVKLLDATTAKLSATSGYTSTSIQKHFGDLEQKILQSSMAQAEFAKSLGRITYDSRGAIQGVGALGTVALATGRELADEQGFAMGLRAMGTPLENAVEEMDKLRAVSDELKLAGGPQALADSFGKLEGILQGVVTKTEEEKGKLRGLMGVLGEGAKTPERADQTRAATMNMLRSRALDIERATGRKVVNDQGELIDPTKTLQDLRALSAKRHGGNTAEMRRALINTYGMDAGLAILRGGFDRAEQLGGLNAPGSTQADADRAKKDPAAQRQAKDLAKQSGLRELAGAFLGVDSFLTDVLGGKGAAGVEMGLGLASAGGLFGGVGKALGFGKGAAAAAGGGEGLLAGGLLGPLALIGGAMLGQVAATASLGQDRDEMGKEWQQGHAKTIGAELARRAQEQGGFSEDLFSRAGGNREALVEMLKALSERKDQLSPSFAKDVAEALAAELRRAPLQVRQPPDPNQSPGGN